MAYIANPIFLGDGTSYAAVSGTQLWDPIAAIKAWWTGSPSNPSNYIIPGSSVPDVIANPATGKVTPAQQQALAQQEQASLVQAGMDPTQAAAQAQSDVGMTLGGSAIDSTWIWIAAAAVLGIVLIKKL